MEEKERWAVHIDGINQQDFDSQDEAKDYIIENNLQSKAVATRIYQKNN